MLRFTDNFQRLVHEVENTAPLAGSVDHGTAHWRAVARTGLYLCTLRADIRADLVLLFALLHDARRELEEEDPLHGPRAAQYLSELIKNGVISLSDEDEDLLSFAISAHDNGDRSDEPTIGACWDGDRLQLQRFNYWLRNELLSHDLSHTLEVQGEVAPYHESDELSWEELFELATNLTDAKEAENDQSVA